MKKKNEYLYTGTAANRPRSTADEYYGNPAGPRASIGDPGTRARIFEPSSPARPATRPRDRRNMNPRYPRKRFRYGFRVDPPSVFLDATTERSAVRPPLELTCLLGIVR